MNKTLKRVLTIALALTLCLSLATPAFASSTGSEPGATEPEKEVRKAVTVYANLILDKDLNNWPTATATIQVAKGTTATDGDFVGRDAILTGLKVGTTTSDGENSPVSSQTITFQSSDTTISGAASGKVANENQKYVSHGVVIDFSGVTFPEPGVYRYKASQSAITVGGYTTAAEEYDICVYVEYVEGKGPQIGGVVVTPKDDDDPTGKSSGGEDPKDPDPNDPEGDNKFKGGLDGEINFNNYYGSKYSITLTKTVTGNQGSRNEEFPFVITLNGDAGTYYIIADNGVVNGGDSQTGATKIEIGNNGEGSGTVYLHDGESVKIVAPKGATYTIAETANGYITSVKIDNADEITAPDKANNGATVTDKEVTGNITVAYTNHKSGDIPSTGVLLTIAPFVLLMIVGIVGVTVMMNKKKYE